MRRFLAGLLQFLRGLSDEEAYARYLADRHAAASGKEWRRFFDSRLRHKYEHPRCC